MRKFVRVGTLHAMSPFIVCALLLGCGGDEPNYSFTLTVTNNTNFDLFISVSTEQATKDLGWSPANRTFNFELVEVYVPEDNPDPECTLLAKKDPSSTVAYASETVKLKGTLHYEWTIN